MGRITEEEIQGQIIRARMQWTEDNEKNSSYFFNLEKSNYVKKNLNKIKLDNNEETQDPNLILQTIKTYYEKLYSENINPINLNSNKFFNNDNIPKLDELDSNECGGPLTMEELETIIKTFKLKKTPGNDGLPIEFYLKFWPVIKDTLLQTFNYSYENDILSTSQRQAIISLLEKPGKNRMFVKNWRPISLINCDCKIMSKCNAERLKKVLPKIIHENQVGFIKGRNIIDAIRTILDILSDTVKRNIGGIILTIDYEKAFDSVNWKFLEKCLEAFNFGNSIIKWVKLFYRDIESCVINNNVTSPYFKIYRGVRQGDPLSPLLFLLVVEVLSIHIRQRDDISGILFNGVPIKLISYADDTTAVMPNIEQAKIFIDIVKEFGKFSGLKINAEKSEALWLGSQRKNSEKPLGVKWPKVLKILGVFVSYDEKNSVDTGFREQITKIKKEKK